MTLARGLLSAGRGRGCMRSPRRGCLTRALRAAARATCLSLERNIARYRGDPHARRRLNLNCTY